MLESNYISGKFGLKAKARKFVCVFTLTLLAVLVAGGGDVFSNHMDIHSAGGRGVFNIGDSEGFKRQVYSEEIEKDILEFEFEIPKDTVVGIWTNEYPQELNPENFNAVRVQLEVENTDLLNDLDFSLELKGPGDEMQVIRLRASEGWNKFEDFIDWDLIGEIDEAVLVVNSDIDEKVSGSLNYYLEFLDLDEIEKDIDPDRDINIFDARGMGAFNIGPSEGNTRRLYSDELEKEVVRFTYTLPEDTVVGVWTKDYPAGLNDELVNAVRARVKVLDEEQVYDLDLSLELKGPGDEMQVIRLRATKGWNKFEEFIDWDLIGEIDEAVLVVNSDEEREIEGEIYFHLEFLELDEIEKDVDPDRDINIFDARGMGAFNIGPSEGDTRRLYSDELGKEVVRFIYSMPEDTVTGLWTKDYPARLNEEKVNAVRARVKIMEEEQVYDLDLSIELKGPGGEMQVIPLRALEGWSKFEGAIDWDSIGEIDEAVFVVNNNTNEKIEGELYFHLEFLELDEIEEIDVDPEEKKTILGASQMGVFNIGPSRGNFRRVFSEKIGRDAIRIDFNVPDDSVVGLWTKDFPENINREIYDSVRIGIGDIEGDRADMVSVVVELKGDKGIQETEIELTEGWTFLTDEIYWDKIGELDEVVFIIKPRMRIAFQPAQFASPVDEAPQAPGGVEGSLLLDLEFGELSFMEKTEGKIIMVLIFGLLLSFAAFGMYKLSGKSYE